MHLFCLVAPCRDPVAKVLLRAFEDWTKASNRATTHLNPDIGNRVNVALQSCLLCDRSSLGTTMLASAFQENGALRPADIGRLTLGRSFG